MMVTALSATHPITFRPFDIERDASMVFGWVQNPHAQYWGMLDSTFSDFIAVYTELLAIPRYQIYIGEIQGRALFLMEAYNPTTDGIGEHYTVLEGDWGMHVLVAPPEKRIHGLTWHIFTGIMDFLFDQPSCKRVIVEPDVNNEKIHRLNKKAGFEYQYEVVMPHKTAHLAFCTAEQYQQAILIESSSNLIQ